jgi:ribosomal protein S27AE
MARPKDKMICPKCGGEMNHHADKLVDPVNSQEAEFVNQTLGGVLKETHHCFGCGNVESRIAKRVECGL